jgi:large subunit ribosomal protein L35
MPKMKTKRAAKKRLRKTASGSLKRNRAWKQHHLETKSPKRRRRLRQGTLIHKSDEARLKPLVPYL